MVRAAVQARGSACSMGIKHGQHRHHRTGTTATAGTTAQLQAQHSQHRSKIKPAVRECMGDPSVCYPWEYEYEGPQRAPLRHCHPGEEEDSPVFFQVFILPLVRFLSGAA